MQSGNDTRFQSAAFGPNGGSHSFEAMTVGNFTASNIGSQLYAPSYIDLAAFDLSSAKGGTLTITVTGTGFTTPLGASNWMTQFTGNITSVNNSSATMSVKSYLNNGNALNSGCATGCTLLSSVGLGGNGTASATTDGLFALTEVITITTTGEGRFSLDASVANVSATKVPEPMSLALLGTGLLGLGIIRRAPRRAA